MNNQTVLEFVGDPNFQVTPEAFESIVPWMEANQDVLSSWFRDNLTQHTYEAELDASEESLLGEDEPMIVYTSISWKNLPADERVNLIDNEDETHDDDYTVLRVTMNDRHVVRFVKEHAADESLERQHTLAAVLRHLTAENAHQTYPMWAMLQKVRGAEMTQAEGVIEGEVIDGE